ncbi:MAG: SAM-dependent methyltransferase [Verrucomicrobiota bacterium]
MRVPDYPIGGPPATPSLATILRERIQRDGPLRFADFMALALYEPALGYYARETRQVGRDGDFFTSVSVGPLFGELLARRFLHEWCTLGSPARWRIIECGAHDGSLANDILQAIARLDPQAFSALEYAIPEPLPRLQAAQREKLATFDRQTRFLTDASKLVADPQPGIAFGNELLDALPFHVVERNENRWSECRVAINRDDQLGWEMHPITDPALQDALARLGDDFPDGYRTEVRTNFSDFLEPLTRSLSSGLLLWLDYGFARPEYYQPDRKTGTLRTFSKHRAAEDPLATPGELDITAHIDFTAVAEAAITLGCQPTVFRNQGTWLTQIGREWLLSLEGQTASAELRQFQTLTHPAHLGGSFHVLELSWNQAVPEPSAADCHRLALQAVGAGTKLDRGGSKLDF